MYWEKLCSHFPDSAFSCFKRISTFCNFTGIVEWSLFIGGKKSESVKWIWTTNLRRTVNPFPNKPRVLCVCSLSLLKTLGKKMLLVRSNFFFSNSISIGIWVNFLPFSSHLKLSSATLSVWDYLKFVVWERVKKRIPYIALLQGMGFQTSAMWFAISNNCS